MKSIGLLFIFFFCLSLLAAQQSERRNYGVELSLGANFTNKIRDNDDRGTGIYTDVSVQRFFHFSDRFSLSGGLGLYMHQFDYTDRNTLSFGCDLPESLGGQGQQTYLTSGTLHAGIFVPARLQLKLGANKRWNIYGGVDLKIPIFGQADFTIFECGNTPVEPRTINNSTEPFRTVIPAFTLGFGYGIMSPKGRLVYVGPFANFSSETHIPHFSFLPSVRTATIGIRASGAI